jgi:hypothetical protein
MLEGGLLLNEDPEPVACGDHKRDMMMEVWWFLSGKREAPQTLSSWRSVAQRAVPSWGSLKICCQALGQTDDGSRG